jgi:hypothetical protein
MAGEALLVVVVGQFGFHGDLHPSMQESSETRI